MVIADDLPVLVDTRALSPELRRRLASNIASATAVATSSIQPPPPAKEARKGGSDEGRVPRAETSIISISSGGSDDSDDDGLALAPLLVARSRTFVPAKGGYYKARKSSI
jgi:hypothetical protein